MGGAWCCLDLENANSRMKWDSLIALLQGSSPAIASAAECLYWSQKKKSWLQLHCIHEIMRQTQTVFYWGNFSEASVPCFTEEGGTGLSLWSHWWQGEPSSSEMPMFTVLQEQIPFSFSHLCCTENRSYAWPKTSIFFSLSMQIISCATPVCRYRDRHEKMR